MIKWSVMMGKESSAWVFFDNQKYRKACFPIYEEAVRVADFARLSWGEAEHD